MDSVTKNNIHIVGLGVAETAVLSVVVQSIINDADIIIGSERQLATITPLPSGRSREQQEKNVVLPALSELRSLLDLHKGKLIVVLASGDPLYYGIGRWFSKHFSPASLRFYPAVSSIQVACHELGLALQDVEVVSLHGRPLEKVRTKLHRNKKLVVLTDKHSQPQILANECLAAGFEQSILTVCENLGYKQQRIRRFLAAELANEDRRLFDPLHVTVIDVLGNGGVLPEFPGIPDAHYLTGEVAGKGMISKREVRLVILSLLQVSKDDIIWDIGAGCGGVSVELAYWNETATVYAIEHHQQRLQYLLQNCRRFGVTHNINIIEGRAPEILKDLTPPNKIFIGGSDGELKALLKRAWDILPVGGVLVASAVIGSTKKMLTQFVETTKNAVVESIEVSIKRGDIKVNDHKKNELVYESRLPVAIFKVVKTVNEH